MKIISYLQHKDEIETFQVAGVRELILGASELSRFGRLNASQIQDYAKELTERDIKPVLEWDILMTEERFNEASKFFESLDLTHIESVRVQDPGAYFYLLENYPDKKVQLILETGNHNLQGIKTWVELGGEQLERVVLSLELPKDKLKQYVNEITVPVEILGLGRILLFYTPRSLVASHFLDHDEAETHRIHTTPIEVSGSSEESPHHGFPILENKHGTFMFNTKDHCLLENLQELEQEVGIAVCRIDLRFHENPNFISKVSQLQQEFSRERAIELKNEYPGRVIRGFYSANKTDVLFKKLKNRLIQRSDDAYLGDVIEVVKKGHIAIMLRNPNVSLKVGDTILFQTPDGKEKQTKIGKIWNSSLNEIENAVHDQVVFVPHIGGVSVRTAVYLV